MKNLTFIMNSTYLLWSHLCNSKINSLLTLSLTRLEYASLKNFKNSNFNPNIGHMILFRISSTFLQKARGVHNSYARRSSS